QESLGSTLASSISSASLNFPFDTPVGARFLNITETHLFSPALVNEFRFGFVHINDNLDNFPPVTVSDLSIDRPTNNVTSSIYKFVLASSGFEIDRKSTRLNSSHVSISYAVFCLKKKKITIYNKRTETRLPDPLKSSSPSHTVTVSNLADSHHLGIRSIRHLSLAPQLLHV